MIVQELMTKLNEMLGRGAIRPDSDIRAYRDTVALVRGVEFGCPITVVATGSGYALAVVLVEKD